ncbi:MAG: hypothetical protein DPW09_07005 [Anaerolineae bacterium]|nr:cytochrome c [Anaerolineales bacterium]MCQ3973180.1 hypothetical protein [Anaerolineae bacterium]
MTTTLTPQQRPIKTEQLSSPQTNSGFVQILTLVALAASLLGLGMAIPMLLTRTPLAAIGQDIQADGLVLRVESAAWLVHEHEDAPPPPGVNVNQNSAGSNGQNADQGQQFPMPASMMPGMPENGQQRLHIELMLRNEGSLPRSFGPDEFRLEASNNHSWKPQDNTSFLNVTVQPGQALNTALSFDIDEAAANLFLVWNRGGSLVRVPMTDPDHDHTGNLNNSTQTDQAAQVAPIQGDPARGQILFMDTCIACHAPGAEGFPGLGKNLVASQFVAGASNADLVAFIKAGRDVSDPLNTTGVAMPPKGGNPALDDQALFDIVAYLRTLQK